MACENARENCQLNQAAHVQVVEGKLEKLIDRHYDLVLANINRHVLLESFLPLYGMLSSQGLLVISGILKSDREMVETAVVEAGFRLEEVREKGQWIAMQLRRP